MYLKTLTLKGFKSFADTTTIELEPGVTVVVGPNGSGKSNVVDAVAWVLGAQGPKVVRSAKMDDVIFAGTTGRAALGRAEVTLTIDNASRRLPVEAAEVAIRRTLFRSGDSEYAINGAPCRLLDVQELLSDAGVGRQQHVIMNQGQLDSVLQARPEDRRMVVEEAAGVLKFRKRKERAERRLDASEQSLLRLQDTQREVRRQLRPLERQAEAARRHDGLAADVRALRLHLAGRDLASLARRLDSAEAALAATGMRESHLTSELNRLDTVVSGTETSLDSMQSWDGADRLGRAEQLLERSRGTARVVSERRRAVAGAMQASSEATVAASLEAESARLTADLDSAARLSEALGPESELLDQLEAELREDRASLEGRSGPPGAVAPKPTQVRPGGIGDSVKSSVESPLGAEADTVRSAAGARDARDDARDRYAREREAAARLAERLAAFSRRYGELTESRGKLAADLLVVATREAQLSADHLAAGRDEERAALEALEAESRERSTFERAHLLAARRDALQVALDEVRARAGVERLGGLAGVLGTLADVVEIEAGCERAFEAAVEDVLGTVVVTAGPAARSALSQLHDAGLHGGVLPVGAGFIDSRTGGDSAGGAGATRPEALRSRVRSRHAGVEPLLDRLLAGVVVCRGDLDQALEQWEADPRTTVVTLEGDRLSERGWRIGAGRIGATRAALEQVRAQATSGELAASVAAAAAEGARARLVESRSAAAAAVRALDALRAERRQLEVALEDADHQIARSEAESIAARTDLEAAHRRVAESEALLHESERELADADRLAAATRASEVELLAGLGEIEERARHLAASRAELEVRAAALDERCSLLAGRRDAIDRRLAGLEDARAQAAARRTSLERASLALARLDSVVSEVIADLEREVGSLAAERLDHDAATSATSEHLRRLRDERAAAERDLVAAREVLHRGEIERSEAALRLETAVDSLRRELDCEADEAIKAPCPELPPGVPAPARLRELERELRLLGPVNPLALEELAALEERDRFLAGQLDDVRGARRELGRVIRAIDDEIVAVFTTAFVDVAAHFEALFATLFPGGSGRLSLLDPEDLLHTGIEIEARPAGRNVRRLSLLSGGERSLVALAFLFAVFRSRPSPFYVMDEVEAALDDVNLHRFLDLVDEFRDEAQLIVVSHQKRTMEAADVLYGVTMQAGGASKVVSERLRDGSRASGSGQGLRRA